MTFLRNLWRDLVEKNLWPIAILLVVALVAVPVFLGTGSSGKSGPVTPPAATSSAAGSPAATAQVSLDTTTTSKPTDRAGAVRNPFKPEHVVAPAPTGTTSATPETTKATSTGATSTPSTTTSPKTSTGSSTPTTSSPTKTSGGMKYFVWDVDVLLGSHKSKKDYKGVSGITALPSRDYPLLTFLGVKNDHKTAVFLVSLGTAVTDGGACLPSRSRCSQLELSPGDSALLTRRAGATHFKRYRVSLKTVKMRMLSDAEAKASAASVHGSVEVSAGAVRGG